MVQTTSHIFSGKVDIESNLLVGSSHLFVDTINNRVGVTTADPDASLHVNGNAYVESNVGVGSNIVLDGDTGVITATEFRGDGSNLSGVLTSLQNATDQGSTSNATIQLTNADTSLVASGNVVISGNVTSLTFIGDGSQLTGIATNLQSITDNGNVTSNTVQFTNTGTSLTASGTIEAAAIQVNGLDVALDQDMSSNAARVAALETELASNVTRVTNLEAANVVQEVLINDLRTDVTSNTSRISSLEADRTSNTVRISILESANIIQESLINNLRTDLTSNTGRIVDLEAANTVQAGLITTIETDLADNASRIYTLETAVPSNTSITELQAANTVQASLISSLESANTVQGGLITALETDLADNVTRIETLETANTVQASLISSLESANTVQGGLITALETATQHISATASGTVISSNLDVTGNIFMRGNTFIVESETKLINDAIIGIANNNTTSTTDVGILMQRPTANVALIHHGGTNDFTIGYTQNDLEATDITNDTTNEINVNVLGNLYTQNNLTVGNVVTASAFVGDGTGITGINLQQVAAVGHTTTTPLITSNTLIGKRTGAFDSKGDSTTEGEVFVDNLNAGEMTTQSISGTQDGSGITLTNPIVITYYVSNWLVNGQSWNDVFHFTFIEGLTYVFDISHISNRVQTSGPHIGNFWITGDESWGAASIPYDQGVHIVGTQGYSGAQFRWTVPRGASSFQGRTAGSHPGPGYFWFMTKPITSGSTSPGQITERRIRVIPNPDQHILTGQTQIHGNLYSDSTIVSTNVEATDTVSSTRALISNVATIGTTKTFVVTVSGGVYYMDGIQQPSLELHENQTYIFDMSDSTNSGHPLAFSTAYNGATSSYTTGVVSNHSTVASGTAGSKVTWTVPTGAPLAFYYYCTVHGAGMGSSTASSISSTAELVVSGRVVASGNVEASKFIGDGSQLTGISGATTSDLQAVTTNGATSTQSIQLTNTGTSLAASGAVTAASVSATGAVTAASVSATGGITAAYFTGDGSNVNIGEMTVETIPYVDANKQLRDSHITRTADKTVITSNLQVDGNLFVNGTRYFVNSEETVINDRIIGLANNNTSTTLDVGLMLQYPQKNVAMIHHGITSGSPHNGQLTLGYTQSGFEVDNITKDPSNNLTLNVWGHVVTQNNITVGSQGSYYGDGTTLTGVALSADLTDNVTRIEDLETATIISNSSAITTGFTRGDIIYASADNVLNKLPLGTSGQVLKSDGTDVVWGTDGGGGGSGSTVWQQNGNKIYYSADNVGINVSDPAFDLDVHGTANVGALTATSLSVGGQTLALASDLSANASRLDAIYNGSIGDIIYVDAANSLAKLGIGSSGQVLKVSAGGLPIWANESGGGGGGGTSQWTTVNTNEIYYDGNVGIANTDPGHDLSVGSNLYVDDDGSNVLVVTGNTAMAALTLGQVSIAASYNLEQIVNIGNVTSNTVQFSNAITSLTAASNIVVAGNVTADHFVGDGSNLTGISSTLQAITDSGNVTSNTIQFSNAITGLVTTANVEVGGELTVSGNVSDLNVVSNVNMLHTANTAAIKLNSNVVTEFPRSKRLVKYPKVAMTGQTTSNHTVTASGWYGSGANYEPWKAFDNVGNHSSGQLAWYSFDHPAPEAYSGTDYAFNPNHGGTATPDLFTGAVQGEWLKIQLPHKVALDHYIVHGPNQENEFPQDWTVYGSVDGTNWNWVDSRIAQIFGDGTGTSGTATGKRKKFYLDTPTNEYLYFGFVFTRGSVNRAEYIGVGEIEIYGIPEYDPEAHGTDVTIKSKANVPNTDWLDIYIDGQDYSTMPSGNGSVLDKSTNNRHGTPSNVTFNSTWKAFEIESASTSNITIPFNSTGGAYVHTISLWFWMDTTAGGRCIFTIRGSESTGRQIALIINQDSTSVGFKYDFYNSDVRYYDPSVVANKWMHVTLTYSGGDNTVDSKEIYLNGIKLGVTASGTSPLNLTGTENLIIGGNLNSGNASFEGMVANFRMFNRVLTSDEIYQLYAYQKEYFGHGDLSMTLKAGRLGIGTSEPRGALDVRGDVEVGGLITSTTKSASGGTESMVGSDRLHRFTTAGMFNVTGADISVEFLIIGGGGGGGRNHAGGGGGGQFVSGTITLPRGVYPIMVGRGGLGGYQTGSYENPGQSGGESRAFGFIARGGGGGGSRNGYIGGRSKGYEGLDGGCGGGGAGTAPDYATTWTTGGYGADSLGIMLGTTQASNNIWGGYGGGRGISSADGTNAGHGGGGGGAGGSGGDASGGQNSGSSGAGGAGQTSSITGTTVTYAGGGSGGVWGTATVGTTNGGGGAGSVNNGSHGTDGLGGGGGGGGDGNGLGGNGGDGIVILRWTP